MPHEYFDRFSEIAKKFQGPIGEIVKLNLETMQKFSYLRPDEVLNNKNPEELISKQIEITFNNMHQLLDYWQDLLLIGERTTRDYLQQSREVVKDAQRKAQDLGKNKSK